MNNFTSRTMTGTLLMILGIILIGVGVFIFPVLIYGIPIFIIGLIIFLNKREDEIEQIKKIERRKK